MKTTVVNLNPELPYSWDNLAEQKKTTIRLKPIPVGTPIALWIKKRGMRKGFYCSSCFAYWGIIGTMGYRWVCKCKKEVKEYPYLLKRSVVKDCICLVLTFSDNFIWIKSKKIEWEEVEYNDCQDAFVEDEGFKTNKDWIDAILQCIPALKKGKPVTAWLMRFD